MLNHFELVVSYHELLFPHTTRLSPPAIFGISLGREGDVDISQESLVARALSLVGNALFPISLTPLTYSLPRIVSSMVDLCTYALGQVTPILTICDNMNMS